MTSSDIVKLNVGGVTFTTTLSTLCRYPSSMLGAMFQGDIPTALDQNGFYFIDRDGDLFKYVLNFLRSSKLLLPANFKDLDMLYNEADFYQISPLLDAITELRSKESKKETHFLEITEVRFGSIATMPTCNALIKSIISGRKDVIQNFLSLQHIHPTEQERLRLNCGKEFVEILLLGSNVRLQVGECLKNKGWSLVESQMSSCSVGSGKKDEIVHNYKDRWQLIQPREDNSELRTNAEKVELQNGGLICDS